MGKDEVWWEKKNSDFEPKNKISGHFGKKTDVSHRKNDKFYNVTINKQGEWLDEPIEVQENSIKKFVSN